SGTASPSGTQTVNEANPRVFTVTGYTGNPTCTANETSVPAGYNSTATCSASLTTGQCTITNTLNSATFTVKKDFSDKPGTDTTNVSITFSCASGTASPSGTQTVNEANPRVFTVTGYTGDPTCTANE